MLIYKKYSDIMFLKILERKGFRMSSKVTVPASDYENISVVTAEPRNLDTIKLRKLFYDIGFRLTSMGTTFIIEELEYFFNNNLNGFNYLKEAYSISAIKHNTEIKKVQWVVQSSISSMLKTDNSNKLYELIPWINKGEIISPRDFMSLMILFLEENEKEYNKM